MVFRKLTETETLWFTFWLTITQTLCFGLVMLVWDFEIIDEIYDARQITIRIAGMTPKQRQVHIWMTATLDVLYPFSYASFFVGATVKAFPGSTGSWLIIPTLLCIPADLIEGYSQVMLLNGHAEYMWVKTIATPIKLILFICGVLIAIISVARLKRGEANLKARKD